MSRDRRPDAADLHARFNSWLLQGASRRLPRDLTLHAAFCDECRRAIGAFDGLALVDVGRASMPPSRIEASHQRRGLPRATRLAAAAGVILLVAAGGAAAGSGLVQLPLGLGGPGETPAQQVLGGTGQPSPSPTPTLSPEAAPTAS